MRLEAFASRNWKEMVRDKLTLLFGAGFPIVLILLLHTIGKSAPVDVFQIDQLTPGIMIFGFSFISLFSAMVISKDRESSFLLRLCTAPMTGSDFILGYTLPLIPLALVQVIVCFALAAILGLEVSINLLWCTLLLMPAALIFIALGLLCGSLFTDKQVGGVCGALLTNLTAWLSGAWFSLQMVGGAFETIGYLLPFAHAVDLGRAAIAGDFSNVWPHFWVVLGYAVVLTIIAVIVFDKKRVLK